MNGKPSRSSLALEVAALLAGALAVDEGEVGAFGGEREVDVEDGAFEGLPDALLEPDDGAVQDWGMGCTRK